MEKKISKFRIVDELLRYFLQDKWWWLAPMIVLLLGFSALVIFAQSSAIAPYFYALLKFREHQ
jgi:hypothetical protein